MRALSLSLLGLLWAAPWAQAASAAAVEGCPQGQLGSAATAAARGLAYSAAAAQLTRAGQPQMAVRCLQLAATQLPKSAVVRRDLGVALASVARDAEALIELRAAEALGDADPELYEWLAFVLARLGRPIEARQAAAQAGSWQADLLGAQLRDPQASYQAAVLLDEGHRASALSALVLAAKRGEEGDRLAALRLAQLAHALALETPTDRVTLDATRFYLGRLRAVGGGRQANLQLRLGLAQLSNPRYLSGGLRPERASLRASLQATGRAQLAVGPLRLYGGLAFEQQAYLVDRDRYQDHELSAYTVELRADYPLTLNPEGLLIGAALRFRDVYGRRFGVHHGFELEGGPVLSMQLTAALRLHMGLFGALRDLIHGEPAVSGSSQDRDATLQRAVFGLSYQGDGLRVEQEGLFVHEDAQGDAFDAIGGGLGSYIAVQAGPRLWLYTRFGALYRSFGAVGDQAIIGAASRRSEVRAHLELGLRLGLGQRWQLEVSDRLVRADARVGHRYTANTVQTALEVAW